MSKEDMLTNDKITKNGCFLKYFWSRSLTNYINSALWLFNLTISEWLTIKFFRYPNPYKCLIHICELLIKSN